MTRLLLVLTIIAAGCGVAPTGETEGSVRLDTLSAGGGGGGGGTTIGCGPDYFAVDLRLGVSTSTINPWGPHTGVVVTYGDDPEMVIYGVDENSTSVVWFMNHGTGVDVSNFEAYPQSMRFCGGGTNNGSAGSGKKDPDPRWLGQCAPNALLGADAADAYWYGPYDVSNSWPAGDSWCSRDGEGGCVPQSCSALGLGCGYQTNNCGQSVYCGACPRPNKCPCGGTYPSHCLLCR
jgi:hypothetical protein